MLKILRDRWAKNEHILLEALKKLDREPNYKDLVSLAFDKIYNHDENEYSSNELDVKKITMIDDGDYQGTYIFLIPFDTYQPDAGEYLMTYAGYGSCSGCDALQGITWNCDPPYSETQTKHLLTLCRHIIMNTIKPYNFGWRHTEEFNQVEFEEETNNA